MGVCLAAPLENSGLYGPLLLFLFAPPALAQDDAVTGVDAIFKPIVDVMATFLFFKIGGENGFPFIVLWLFVAAIFLHVSDGVHQPAGLQACH